MHENDIDRLVAAILAAAKVSTMGQKSASDYIAEYESFLGHFRKQAAEKPTDPVAQDQFSADIEKVLSELREDDVPLT